MFIYDFEMKNTYLRIIIIIIIMFIYVLHLQYGDILDFGILEKMKMEE
jgi:hypothetical protein